MISRAYLPVLRALNKTFTNDAFAQRQVVAAIRMSVADMMNAGAPDAVIAEELNNTEKMIRFNLAQVAYNANLDSFSVKLTEDMVPKDGVVVDIKTPGDLLEEQDKGLDDAIGRASCSKA